MMMVWILCIDVVIDDFRVKIDIMYGSEVIGSSASESYPVGPQTTQGLYSLKITLFLN